jgi:hypothetical protein
VRWLVLVVILIGTFISSVGGTNSHGIAAIAATIHAVATSSDKFSDHAHEADVDGPTMPSHGTAGDHPHHGADHSHEKAHAPPVAWNSAARHLPEWFAVVPSWTEMVRASRLERPPMG